MARILISLIVLLAFAFGSVGLAENATTPSTEATRRMAAVLGLI